MLGRLDWCEGGLGQQVCHSSTGGLGQQVCHSLTGGLGLRVNEIGSERVESPGAHVTE